MPSRPKRSSFCCSELGYASSLATKQPSQQQCLQDAIERLNSNSTSLDTQRPVNRSVPEVYDAHFNRLAESGQIFLFPAMWGLTTIPSQPQLVGQGETLGPRNIPWYHILLNGQSFVRANVRRLTTRLPILGPLLPPVLVELLPLPLVGRSSKHAAHRARTWTPVVGFLVGRSNGSQRHREAQHWLPCDI